MINIGLNDKQRNAVIETLTQYLGSLYVLNVKTQGYHWNVVDGRFKMLHEQFEELYNGGVEAVDETAERIRALGEFAPATLADMVELSILEDEQVTESNGDEMLASLLADHELLIQNLREWIRLAQDNEDEVTADYYIARLAEHEKNAWMLRSSM